MTQIIHSTYSSLWGFSVVGRQAGQAPGQEKQVQGPEKAFQGRRSSTLPEKDSI